MNKAFSRVPVSLAALALATVLAGCTASPDKTAQDVEITSVGATLGSEVSQAPVSEAASDQLAALNAYVSAAQPIIPDLLNQNPGLYSEIQINAIDADTVEYAYFYAEQADASGAGEYFDGLLSTFQSAVDTAVIPEMEQEGILVDPKVRYTYYNADGTLIWSHTFARS